MHSTSINPRSDESESAFRDGRRRPAISFNNSFETGALLSFNLRVSFNIPSPQFLGAVGSVSRALLMAHYLQTNITRRIPTLPSRAPRLPRRVFPTPSEGEDTYKVQYRYPYRDIPNIVVSISSVATTWEDACLDVARYARRSASMWFVQARYIPSRIYTKSSRLAEEARFDESKNKRTIPKPPLDMYPDRLRLTGCSRVQTARSILRPPSRAVTIRRKS